LKIGFIERVIVAVRGLDAAREQWARAGFALQPGETRAHGVAWARLAAGAIEIDLCSTTEPGDGPLAAAIEDAAARGGGIIGWVWGATEMEHRAASANSPESAPGRILLADLDGRSAEAMALSGAPPGVWWAAIEARSEVEARRSRLRAVCGSNPNSVDYLEHIVVVAPVLEDAIAAHESRGVPCKRIREAGNGTRQAFFKLEQTVIEVAGPARGRAGCWGLAFMCGDIRKAVAAVRSAGLQATEPKPAVQGGLIARIVDPLDGVAIAFMEAPSANQT